MAEKKKPKTHQEKVKETTKKTTAQIINEITKTKRIINALGDGLAIMDRTFKILYENQVHKDMFGDRVGEPCYKAYQKREGICGGCPVALTFKDGNVHTVQREHTDKGTRYFEITASPLRDTTGQIVAGIELVRDITERKKTEQQLSIFKRFAEVSSLAYGFADLDGNIIYSNPTLRRILGEENPEDVLGKNVEIYYPDDMKSKLLNEVIPTVKSEGGWIGELPLISINGDVTPAIQNVSLIRNEKGEPLYLGNVITDITERKRAEEALLKERDFSNSVIKTAQSIILVMDVQGHIITFNPYMEEILGCRLEEVQGKDWFATFLPEHDQDSIRELFLKAISGIQTKGNVNPIVTKDGRERIIEWYDKTLKDANGNIIGLLCIGQDITEQKQAKKDITNRIKELEDFYALSINRELKMTELKNEIVNLKKELEKYKKQE